MFDSVAKAGMKIEVPLEVIAQTKHCQKEFACLNKPGADLCKAERDIVFNNFFFRCATVAPCNYKIPSDNGHYCVCPTRIAIFEKYKM